MGYYTDYSLTVQNDDHPQFIDFVKWIEEKNETPRGYSLYSFWAGNGDSCKWYEHPQDMKHVSEKFPDLLFLLEGKGEEPGDIWKKYFKNGKMQVCEAKIQFDSYDESKLQEITERTFH